MASRRIRMKAVINLPQRRGKEPEQTPVPINQDSVAPQTAASSVPSESAVEDTELKSVALKQEGRNEDSDMSVHPVLTEPDPQPAVSSPGTRGIMRKRLKPTVNLPSSRQPKRVRIEEPLPHVTDVSPVQGADPSKIASKQPSESDISEKTSEGFVIPTSKNIPKRLTCTTAAAASNVETIQIQSTASRPSRPNLRLVVNTETPSVEPLTDPAPSVDPTPPTPPTPDTPEGELPPTSKTEKRTTHRRLRKNGAGEMLTKARRDFHLKFGNKKPDKKMLTMFDLIFYNPASNPMQCQEAPVIDRPVRTEDEVSERLEEERVDDVSDEEVTSAVPAPQVKVGPDGQLVVDEKSLVIETTGATKRRSDLANSELVVDLGVGNTTTYSSFTNRIKSKDWSKQETLKFYRALNSVGTDFLLMQSIFPKRTRKDLKIKFKKEDRLNRELVDKALKFPIEFDLEQLKKDLAQEEKENEEKRQRELKLLKDKEANKPKRQSGTKSGKKSQKTKVPKSFLEKTLEPPDIDPDSTTHLDYQVKRSEPPVKKKPRRRRSRPKLCFESLSSSSDDDGMTFDEDPLDIGPLQAEARPVKTDIRPTEADVRPVEADTSQAEAETIPVEAETIPAANEARPVARSLTVADDVDFSSSDDEITFLKTTRQTRYGRIPQRRIASSESESEEEESAEEAEVVPELSKAEPGSIVIVSTPGQSTYQLFMVGPRTEPGGKSKMTPIGVTLTPEVLAAMTGCAKEAGNVGAAEGEAADASQSSSDNSVCVSDETVDKPS